MILEETSLFSPADVPAAAGEGWQLIERPDLGTVQVVIADEELATLTQLAAHAGPIPSIGGAGVLGNHTVLRLAPRRFLLACSREDEASWTCRIASTSCDGRILATAFGDHLPWLDLVGTEAAAVLACGAFLEVGTGGVFPVGRVRRMHLARVPVVLHRVAEQVWRIGIERSYAAYLRAWMIAAAGDGRRGTV